MTINDNDTILANAHAPLHPATMTAAAAFVRAHDETPADLLLMLGLGEVA